MVLSAGTRPWLVAFLNDVIFISGDLIVDNLSSNIEVLQIERRQGTSRQQQQQQSQSSLENYSNYQQLLLEQHERYQSTQLQTPEVSMDDIGMKRGNLNNLNKF